MSDIEPAPGDDRAAYAMRIIMARCPEIGPRDLDALAGAQPDSDTGISPEIADRIMDVLLAFEQRFDRIERAVSLTG